MTSCSEVYRSLNVLGDAEIRHCSEIRSPVLTGSRRLLSNAVAFDVVEVAVLVARVDEDGGQESVQRVVEARGAQHTRTRTRLRSAKHVPKRQVRGLRALRLADPAQLRPLEYNLTS